jgi:hypothetical protein
MNLLDLPNELIYNMLHVYFDPISSLRCLGVCQKLQYIANRDLIIKRILQSRMLENFKKQMSECIICPKCHIKLETEQSLKFHLQKHISFEKKGKEMKFGNPLTISKCYDCEMPTSNFTRHNCLLNYDSCYNGDYRFMYKWSTPLCEKFKWHRNDPTLKKHICYSECLFCHQIFKTDYDDIEKNDGFHKHMDECEFKENIKNM